MTSSNFPLKISAESPIKRRGSILSSSSSDNDDDERELEAKLEEQIADKVEEVLEPVVDNVKTEHPDVIITDSIPERENWDRSLSIKIDSSYFQKSALEESFEGGISILDESGTFFYMYINYVITQNMNKRVVHQIF